MEQKSISHHRRRHRRPVRRLLRADERLSHADLRAARQPGGLCTSWKRKGYTFDGCIHWLVGSRPAPTSIASGRSWARCRAGGDRSRRVPARRGPGGKAFIVYTDVDRLEQHMKELAPGMHAAIEELTQAVRTCASTTCRSTSRPSCTGRSMKGS